MTGICLKRRTVMLGSATLVAFAATYRESDNGMVELAPGTIKADRFAALDDPDYKPSLLEPMLA